MQNQLNETSRAKEQLERIVFNLVEEVRQVKTKSDTQAVDLQAVSHELRSKSHKLEEDSRQAVSYHNIQFLRVCQIKVMIVVPQYCYSTIVVFT